MSNPDDWTPHISVLNRWQSLPFPRLDTLASLPFTDIQISDGKNKDVLVFLKKLFQQADFDRDGFIGWRGLKMLQERLLQTPAEKGISFTEKTDNDLFHLGKENNFKISLSQWILIASEIIRTFNKVS